MGYIVVCRRHENKKKSMISMRLNGNQHKMYKWFNIVLSSGGKLNRFFIQFFCMFFLLFQQKVKIESRNYPRCDWHSHDSSGPRLIHKMWCLFYETLSSITPAHTMNLYSHSLGRQQVKALRRQKIGSQPFSRQPCLLFGMTKKCISHMYRAQSSTRLRLTRRILTQYK